MSELRIYSQCYDGTDGLFYLKSDVDKAIEELKEQHERKMKELEYQWKEALDSREQELRKAICEREVKDRRVLEHMATPSSFQDDLCNVLRTCERESNPAPAYDFLRGINAGWWLCDRINSPPEQRFEERIRESLDRAK